MNTSRNRLFTLLGILMLSGIALAYQYQSVSDGTQTFSNDKTWNGSQFILCTGPYGCNLTVGGDAGVTGALQVTGTFTSNGAVAQNGNEAIVGDAGVTGSQQATLGFQIGPATGLDWLTDQGGIAQFDGGVVVGTSLQVGVIRNGVQLTNLADSTFSGDAGFGKAVQIGALRSGVELTNLSDTSLMGDAGVWGSTSLGTSSTDYLILAGGGSGATVDVNAGTLGVGNTTATTVNIGQSTSGVVQIASQSATAAKGFRNGSTNVVSYNSSAGAVDCAGAGITATVAQVIGSVIYTCATSQTVTLPTAKGASGIVQALPGTPAVGDVFYLHLAENHATNTLTLAANADASETIYGIATITNGGREWRCRVTSITNGSEAVTCY